METSGLPLGVNQVVLMGCEGDISFAAPLSADALEGVIGKGENAFTCGILGCVVSIDDCLLLECGAGFNVSGTADQLQAKRTLGQDLCHALADFRQGAAFEGEIHGKNLLPYVGGGSPCDLCY